MAVLPRDVGRAPADERLEVGLRSRLDEVDERLADHGDDAVRRRLHAARSPDLAPVMIATASGIVIDFVSTSAARRPRRWMWMRSDTSNTCGMLWLIRMTGSPRSRIRRMRSRTIRDSLTPSAAVGS